MKTTGKWVRVALVAGLASVLTGTGAQASFVTVGNPGNAADTHGDGYGAVAYEYNIAKHEVTAGDWTTFLSDAAATDTYGLYNTNMSSHTYGCKIAQSGSSGSYTYAVASDYADRPVNYVSWYDAARYTNWLTTGGVSTETGVYTFTGATTMTIDRAGALGTYGLIHFIPTEDEWYKAAYHKNDGVTGNYWDYPTGSDSIPTSVAPPGGANSANYYGSTWAVGAPYYRSEVGAYADSASPYGTFDQGGNVWEWNETLIGSNRGLRGGSFYGYVGYLHADYRSYGVPTFEYYGFGFRVASIGVASSAAIPEPGSLGLLGLGLLSVLARRRRVAR